MIDSNLMKKATCHGRMFIQHTWYFFLSTNGLHIALVRAHESHICLD